MVEYLAPGVYVEEVPSGARRISAVGTSTAALFGVAPKANMHFRVPWLLTNMSEFQQVFIPDEEINEPSPFASSVAGFFINGGSRLYVVNLGSDVDTITNDDLSLIDAIEEINLIAAPGYTDEVSQEALISHCEGRNDRFAVLDTAENPQSVKNLVQASSAGGDRPRGTDQGVAACYWPWIETIDVITSKRVASAPSGHICGLYASVDLMRGVHKAPANISIHGAIGLTHAISPSEQSLLNPAGVNCIRAFEDGIRVCGARTLANASSDFRHVPVRRLVTMISQSIEQGTRWVVFETNNLTLWKSLRRDIGNFLTELWRDGALMGATAEDAFFVKCDSETTTQVDIENGRVKAVVGIAPVKPAEFVIIRIDQLVDQAHA
ncbi:MAG: phage tail sheath family protein [Granulosicoccus sp.]